MKVKFLTVHDASVFTYDSQLSMNEYKEIVSHSKMPNA